MSYKNVHFYRMNYFKKEIIKVHGKADEEKINFFSKEELKKKFEELIDKETSENCLILEAGYNQVTLEILENNDDYIFARLGRMQDIRSVHLRNKKTLKATPIQKAIDQEIEIFTYLIINKNNMVIAYITEQGAPHIRKIDRVSDKYLESLHFIEAVPIPIPDALEVLKKKKKITKFDYKIALPINKLLDKDHLNLPVEDFIKLKDLKSATIQITVTGQKEKNIIENISDNISILVDKIKTSKFGTTEKISFNAKNEGEYTHTYNIFDEYFVRKTRMNTEQMDRLISQLEFKDEDYAMKVQKIIHTEIKNKLLAVYHVNEDLLIEYNK